MRQPMLLKKANVSKISDRTMPIVVSTAITAQTIRMPRSIVSARLRARNSGETSRTQRKPSARATAIPSPAAPQTRSGSSVA